MKVLYIGYYREQSDWGRQTVNNILALEKAGVDVVCRSIELGGGDTTPREIVHLENKDSSDATHCIQHVFPEHMVGTEKFQKNVGLLTNNFVNIEFSSWVEKLILMDEIWVPSMTCWTDYLPEAVRAKSKVVPLAIDTSVFKRQYQPINIPEVRADFKFYTIFSTNDATGLSWVLSSFHAEFDTSEPVSLVIQVSVNGDGSRESKKIEDLSSKIKSLLRLQSGIEWYKKDIIISAPNVTQENLLSLHSYCDCYVSCNPSVTFQLSEINAAGFGNTPIVSSLGTVQEYTGDSCGVVNSIHQIVQGQDGRWKDTNNGKDFWIRPCEQGLRKQMRKFYEEYKSDPIKHKIDYKIMACKMLDQYSLEKVGKLMEATLCLEI